MAPSNFRILQIILTAMVVFPSLGHSQTSNYVLDAATPSPNSEITIERQRAFDLFLAVTGLRVSIDDDRLIKMEAKIKAGDELGAVQIATADRAFYNVRLTNMAKKMADRDESIQAPLSDFVATFVGVVRDNIDARQLLTGNFFYRGDAAKVLADTGKTLPVDDASIRTGNGHYVFIENARLSLYDVLIKENGQRLDGTGGTLPDAAGLLTTRGFVAAHANAGTNRRMVEYAFREFMCTPIADWKDATRPDDMVGRDVDRFAGGGNSRYQTTCKACHTQLDSFRTAFAYLDFNGGVTYSAPTVAGKLNRNAGTFPSGFVTTNDRFVNNAQGPLIVDKFGWRGTSTGRGMNEFGQMLASSKGFSRCMVRRLFTEICKREASVDEEEIVRSLADRFEGTYKIKDLAEMIAVHPMCLEKRH